MRQMKSTMLQHSPILLPPTRLLSFNGFQIQFVPLYGKWAVRPVKWSGMWGAITVVPALCSLPPATVPNNSALRWSQALATQTTPISIHSHPTAISRYYLKLHFDTDKQATNGANLQEASKVHPRSGFEPSGRDRVTVLTAIYKPSHPQISGGWQAKTGRRTSQAFSPRWRHLSGEQVTVTQEIVGVQDICLWKALVALNAGWGKNKGSHLLGDNSSCLYCTYGQCVGRWPESNTDTLSMTNLNPIVFTL